MKYLLSNGKSTDKIEYYILDLFKLHLKIYPGDIPGAKEIGANFVISDRFKADIPKIVKERVSELVAKFSKQFSMCTKISVVSIDIVDSETASIVISVNDSASDEITLNLYDEDL